MTPGTTEYGKLYGQAHAAYCQGNLEVAAGVIEGMAEKFPDDANVLLLRGHIHLGLQEYSSAKEQYERVLQLTEQPDLVDYANRGLDQVRSVNGTDRGEPAFKTEESAISEPAFQITEKESGVDSDFERWEDEIDWDNAAFNEDDYGEPTLEQVKNFTFPEEREERTGGFVSPAPEAFPVGDRVESNPFNDIGAIREEVPAVKNKERGQQESLSLQWDEEMNWEDQNLGEPSSASAHTTGFLDNLEGLGGLSQFDLGDLQFPTTTDVSSSFPQELNTTVGFETVKEFNQNKDMGEVNWMEISDKTAPRLSSVSERSQKPKVEVQPGKLLAWFKNAPLRKKQWTTALAAGLAASFTVFVVCGGTLMLNFFDTAPKLTETKPQNKPEKKTGTKPQNQSEKQLTTEAPLSLFLMLWLTALTGLASFTTTLFLTEVSTGQIKRTLQDLENQCEAISEGDFNVKATIYSEDELGQLAARFNLMSRVILTITSDAQRRAAETEQAREDLQRQVIRLLDEVEGAARGDLTVEAEVTADVLGAVADAFNLTITNLREIVRQVKKAATQVNKSSTNSELFARNQSSDALRVAEELAVTLNSVQIMNEAIQRVAENAREAEDVARSSSVTALKGGEAVERTVAGILQIRETVSETARKVKRLAQASQEISKIVVVISNIASRTNLLALNASIQAARAGEAGKGFALVADEVRELANKSSRQLKDIEEIVLQIQTETGSVMKAMEEGIQQVLDVTERSELAKHALEEIIQVANRINTLVISITGATVQQRENSRAVAQVMQSVELAAQETSQESQRVAVALQNLVSISRDLLTSVERFRIEKTENK
jgi:twitching motility protein PilJ